MNKGQIKSKEKGEKKMRTRRIEKLVGTIGLIGLGAGALIFVGSVGGFVCDAITAYDLVIRMIISMVSGAVGYNLLMAALKSMRYHEKHGYPRRKRNRRVA